MKTSSSPNVLIDGATGYLGSHLAYALDGSEYGVRCLVHTKAGDEDIASLKACHAQIFRGSLTDASSEDAIRLAFRNVVAAVHLIGSIAPKRGEKLSDLHVEQTRAFVEYCQEAGVERIIMITSLGCKKDAKSQYHKTKWQAEEVVRQSGIPYVILRPSLIVGRTYGRRDSKMVSRYLRIIETKPIVPLIAGGGNKVQPIFVGDLVFAIMRCVFEDSANDAIFGHEFDLGGPEVVTMREFVEMLMTQVVGKKRAVSSIPVPLASMLSVVMQMTQEVPTLSLDQVRIAQQDNICHENALKLVLGIEPTPLSKSLATYRGKTPPKTNRPQEVS
jgi:uncharacterized protein YbjT (DUF2867 family)